MATSARTESSLELHQEETALVPKTKGHWEDTSIGARWCSPGYITYPPDGSILELVSMRSVSVHLLDACLLLPCKLIVTWTLAWRTCSSRARNLKHLQYTYALFSMSLLHLFSDRTVEAWIIMQCSLALKRVVRFNWTFSIKSTGKRWTIRWASDSVRYGLLKHATRHTAQANFVSIQQKEHLCTRRSACVCFAACVYLWLN